MFSQSKQSQPTFKIVIRSDLTSTSPPDDHKMSPNSASLDRTTVAKQNESAQPIPSTTSAPDTTFAGDIERKRKHSDKDGGLLATKKVYAQLGRWNQKREELGQSQPDDDSGLPVQKQQEQLAVNDDDYGGDTDYGDYQLMACLLCNRKFKSASDVTRHQVLSDLHKKNSQDPVVVEKARLKLRQTSKELPSTSSMDSGQGTLEEFGSSSSINYRNRAAERRQAYHQPERPSLDDSYKRPPPMKSPQNNNKKPYENAASVSIPMKDDNVGARMLKQMGWKKGQGLGKEGSGITNPITAERYAQGAGLGSSNSKSRVDSSSGGGNDTYKDRARELARRRLQEEL